MNTERETEKESEKERERERETERNSNDYLFSNHTHSEDYPSETTGTRTIECDMVICYLMMKKAIRHSISTYHHYLKYVINIRFLSLNG